MSLSACRGRAPTRGIDGWSLTSAVGSGSTRSSISSMGSRRRRCIEDGFCGGRSRRAVARRSWWRFQTKFSPQEAPVSTNDFAPSREVARAALAMPLTTRRVRASTWTEGELQHEVLVGGAQQASTVADRHGSKCSTPDPGGGARSPARDLDDGDASRVGGEIYGGRFRQAVAHRCCTVAAPNRVPSVMICGQPSKGKAIVQSEEENAMECANLSSTLQKLYLWEKKLLEEVKTVEKIRVHYEQKRKDQIKLYHGGAEAHKLEAVEIVVKKLSAKMSIAIQIVNATAKKIDNTRDEELWPQIHQFIQGFMQMWHTMSECHQVQCRALSYARCIESTMADARFNQGHMDLVKQLELQLLDMAASFAGLFNAQKRYATSMNEWLKRGIQYEPELTDDGVPPFSPGRLGAPPLFSVCNSWTVSMERISETEVVGAMQTLASNVMGLWEQHRSEWRKAVLDNSNDLERDLRSIDMDELVLRKAVEARSKKLMLATNQRSMSSSAQASEAPHAEAGLQACMNKVFEAMESFAAACENVYKDLHLRAEEEKA